MLPEPASSAFSPLALAPHAKETASSPSLSLLLLVDLRAKVTPSHHFVNSPSPKLSLG